VSKPLPLTERQVTALAKGAVKAGCVAEVKIGDVVVRLIPKGDAQETSEVESKGKGYF
jgi:hypothetical protein